MQHYGSWAKDAEYEYRTRDGHRLIEVLLYQHQATHKYILPGTLVLPSEVIPLDFARKILASVEAYQACRC